MIGAIRRVFSGTEVTHEECAKEETSVEIEEQVANLIASNFND